MLVVTYCFTIIVLKDIWNHAKTRHFPRHPNTWWGSMFEPPFASPEVRLLRVSKHRSSPSVWLEDFGCHLLSPDRWICHLRRSHSDTSGQGALSWVATKIITSRISGSNLPMGWFSMDFLLFFRSLRSTTNTSLCKTRFRHNKNTSYKGLAQKTSTYKGLFNFTPGKPIEFRPFKKGLYIDKPIYKWIRGPPRKGNNNFIQFTKPLRFADRSNFPFGNP